MPEDSLALGDKMAAGLKAAYEALQRNIVARRRVLQDGLKQVSGLGWEEKKHIAGGRHKP